MDLQRLYQQHDQEKEAYNILRDKTWANMKLRHNNIVGAFQSKENLPEGYFEKMEKEVDEFNSEWSIPNGRYYKNMILQHEQNIDNISCSLEPKDLSTQSFFDKLSSTKEFDKEAQKDEGDMDKLKAFEKNKDDMDLDQL